MQPDWESVVTWLTKNKGRAIGAALGFGVGLLIILVGVWRGLFLAACVWVGWLLGSRVDAHESLADLINRLLPPGE